jgi:putative transposase
VKKTRLTESQIFQRLREAEAGIPVPDMCRKHDMSSASFCKWLSGYGGIDVS